VIALGETLRHNSVTDTPGTGCDENGFMGTKMAIYDGGTENWVYKKFLNKSSIKFYVYIKLNLEDMKGETTA